MSGFCLCNPDTLYEPHNVDRKFTDRWLFAHGNIAFVLPIPIEQLIGELLLVKMQPAVLEVALQVEQELQTRLEEADRIRYQHVEQARYEMDAARQRYLAIDPHNRLVAGELEAHWNDTIGAYRAAQATYEQQRAADQLQLSDQQQQSIRDLCHDFPTVWNNSATPQKKGSE